MLSKCFNCDKQAIVAAKINDGKDIKNIFLCESCLHTYSKKAKVEVIASGDPSFPIGYAEGQVPSVESKIAPIKEYEFMKSDERKADFVCFEDVKECFGYFCSDNELFFFEIVWDILTKAGMTKYKNDHQYAAIYVYPYVISMLNGEFAELMFDACSEFNEIEYDPEYLPGVALGWLYRDAGINIENYDDEFDESSMFRCLVEEYRKRVAEPIFTALEYNLLLLLWYYTAVTPVEEDEDGYETEIIFSDAKEYYDFCKEESNVWKNHDLISSLASSVTNPDIALWLSEHSYPTHY